MECMRKSLDLTKETDQLKLWRKLTRALKHVHKENNKNIEHIDEVDLETRRIAKFHLSILYVNEFYYFCFDAK